MTVKVQMVNGGSDSVDFTNAAGTTLAQVKCYDDTSSNGHLEFYTNTSGTLSEKVRVQNGLHIQQDSSSNNRLVFRGQPSSSYRWNIDNYSSSNLMRFFREDDTTAGSGVTMMSLDSGGNLLVGGSSVVYYSHVLSTFNGVSQFGFVSNETSGNSGSGFHGFTVNGTAIGSITRNGTSNAVLFNTTSDQRLKENIADADTALDIVDAIKVRKYDWKEGGQHEDFGFIAQEIAQVVNNVVSKGRTEEDMWSLDYGKLTPLLVKAIQEQQAMIEELKIKVAALEAK